MNSSSKPKHIARWDLDKTYLRTEFDTVKDLLRTALEKPHQKKSHPGATSLLLEIQRCGSEIHVLSGSPEQMRGPLAKKLALDGIRVESLTLKPNLRNILTFRFRAVRDQLGYKFPALLSSYLEFLKNKEPSNSPIETVPETLFGDDSEADAFVYALYRDVLKGLIHVDLVERLFRISGIYEDILQLTKQMVQSISFSSHFQVKRICIHLERLSSPSLYASYGPEVTPFYNYFQAAWIVFEDDHLDARGVVRVAEDLLENHNFTEERLVLSLCELQKRFPITRTRVEEVLRTTSWMGELKLHAEFERFLQQNFPDQKTDAPPSTRRGSRISFVPDYVHLVKTHNPRTKS